MSWSSVHLIPLSAFLLLPITFITTYLVSVFLNDVAPEFPYISDTGTNSPESCIFSQLLNIVSFLFLFSIYLRYKQIEQYYRDHLSSESAKILSRNRSSLYIGGLSCFGLSIVANFQETNLLLVHLIGAFTCFGAGIIYCYLQTWMSFKTYPLVNSRAVAYIRLFLCKVMTISFIVHTVTGVLSFEYYHGTNPRKWVITDGGYWLHVSSSIAEWVMVFTFDLFIATYITEMKKISLTSPKIIFIVDNVNSISATNYPYLTDDQIEIYPGSRSSVGSGHQQSQHNNCSS